MTQVICADKRESLRTHVIGVFRLAKTWWKNGKITDSEYGTVLGHIRKLNDCCALAESIEDLENGHRQIEEEDEAPIKPVAIHERDVTPAPESQSCYTCAFGRNKANRGMYCDVHREFLHLAPGDRMKIWCSTLPNKYKPDDKK